MATLGGPAASVRVGPCGKFGDAVVMPRRALARQPVPGPLVVAVLLGATADEGERIGSGSSAGRCEPVPAPSVKLLPACLRSRYDRESCPVHASRSERHSRSAD